MTLAAIWPTYSPTRRLLGVPLHLQMLVTLQERGHIDPARINTRMELFTAFYRSVSYGARLRAELIGLTPLHRHSFQFQVILGQPGG